MAAAVLAVSLPRAAVGQGGQSFTIPERIGVVDVIPNSQSGETTQDAEPSLGLGTGTNFGKLVLVVGGPQGDHLSFTSTNGGFQWAEGPEFVVGDATVDWSAGGLAYMASMPLLSGRAYSVEIDSSTNPSVAIVTSNLDFLNEYPGNVDQPNITVVNVNGTDQIYVGHGNGAFSPDWAAVHFSVNSGTTWTTESLEHGTPGLVDSLSGTRVAASADGKTVYAVFLREQSEIVPDPDTFGDVVVVRDDNSGLNGFKALPINSNGGNDGAPDTQVVRNVLLPTTTASAGTSLGAQRLGGDTAIAVHPENPAIVYVGYVEVLDGQVLVRLACSTNSGQNFQLVYSNSVASAKPTLAVAEDGTVGLLFAELAGNNMEIHLFKATHGDFTQTNELVLASFPDNDPQADGWLYVGDFFQLRTEGDNFYGTFCASGQPLPGHFPCGVFYQRNVEVSGVINSNFWLATPGTLVDTNGNPVAYSIDPFFFYDIAPEFVRLPIFEFVPFWFLDPSDPLKGITHVRWPVLPLSYPQFQLQSAPELLASGTGWRPAGVSPLNINGMFSAPIAGTQAQQFFRLSQNVAGSQFNLFASADESGIIEPTGVTLKGGLQTQVFTATPNNNYAIKQWFLDGVVVQSNAPTLTLSNISAEHIVHVAFVALNDISVTLDSGFPLLVNSNFNYEVRVQNCGLNPVTNVRLTNTLPAAVAFNSALPSQGSVGLSAPQIVSGNLGSLAPGALATIALSVTPGSTGSITDIVTVACDQFEPNLANNTATDIATVYAPVMITNQPASQSVSAGGTASFTVGASGSPPIFYQWFFNGELIPGATNNVLTLTNVSSSQAGSYSAGATELVGVDAGGLEAESDTATLTVGP